MNPLVLPLGLVAGLALAGAASAGSSNRRPLTTATLTARIAALSPAEAYRVQQALEAGLLSGWTRPRERLTPAELAEMVGLAIHQHTFDATEPNRRAQDHARVRVALGSRATQAEAASDAWWAMNWRKNAIERMDASQLERGRAMLVPAVARRRDEVATQRAQLQRYRTEPPSYHGLGGYERSLAEKQEALVYHEVELALIEGQERRRKGSRSFGSEYQTEYFHVTDASSVSDIQKNGFRPGWGDVGYGVYLYGTLTSAQRFARRGGWDKSLKKPVILEIEDSRVRKIESHELDSSWDRSLYTDMFILDAEEEGPEFVQVERLEVVGPVPRVGRGSRSVGPHLVEGPSPIAYPPGHAGNGLPVQRLALVDPSASPATPLDTYFVTTEHKITRSPVTGKMYAKPKVKVVPGAGPTVVGFLDYHVLPYTNGAIYLDFYTVRRDHRGQGLGRRLIDEFYLKFAGAPWIDWGKVMPDAGPTWDRMRKDPGNPKTYGKLW